MSVGNDKPASLKEAERQIWQYILAIATGQMSSENAVRNFLLQALNTNKLWNEIPAREKAWLEPGNENSKVMWHAT